MAKAAMTKGGRPRTVRADPSEGGEEHVSKPAEGLMRQQGALPGACPTSEEGRQQVPDDLDPDPGDVQGETGGLPGEIEEQAGSLSQDAELLALMRELDAFAHTVAHDLKQPLTVVMGFADMLSEEIGGQLDDQQERMLDGIQQGARRMNSIVEGLLLLASTRRSEIALRPLDMGAITREVRRNLSAMIDEAGAEVILPAAWPPAAGFGPWVESVWSNYMSNAIKYGGRPPRIELGGEEGPEETSRFWVKDNGRGLTPEEQGRLFLSFSRLGQPRSLGHGLGLTIVRRIVERLGGEAGAESEAGKGSTFWFTLPRGT